MSESSRRQSSRGRKNKDKAPLRRRRKIMRKNIQKTNDDSTARVQNKKSAAYDICIAARLMILGFFITLANAIFNFIYFGGQRKVKITYLVRLINRFANRCALSFNRLESKLSFNIENNF